MFLSSLSGPLGYHEHVVLEVFSTIPRSVLYSVPSLQLPRPITDPARPNSPKLLQRLLGRLPGKLGVLGGVIGQLERLPRGLLQQHSSRQSPGSLPSSPPAVSPAVARAPPSTPSFSGSLPLSSLRSSFGEFGLAGSVTGRGIAMLS